MKILILLTLFAGSSTVILYNVAPYWEQTDSGWVHQEQVPSPPQMFGQLNTEDGGWKTTIIYGDQVCDVNKGTYGDKIDFVSPDTASGKSGVYGLNENYSFYDSYSYDYNNIETSYWPAPRYECDSIYDDLYLQHYRDLEYGQLDLYSDYEYNPNYYDSWE